DDYGGLVYTLLQRIVQDRDTAKDLAQDTFVKAWTRLRSLRKHASFPSWICSTARRTALDHLRTIKARKEVSMPAESFVESPDEDKPELSAEGIALLERAVCKLSERDRQLITLAYWKELSFTDVGRIMGIPESNVRVYLHRARKRLRELLRGHENELLQQID
ncbi:MAG: sigma-70 family RNA polymerase sigma factor, partial [Candidatus Aegiribacteria sp.]|nr:sigma-70 family RNA polymerase sigma factor [Candidatus Aegiribacteria sp.]